MSEERKSRRRPEASLHGSHSRERGADPQPPLFGFLHEDLHTLDELPKAVFGQYSKGLIAKLLPWLRCERSEILHVCSGCLPRGEGIRVDMRADAKPDIIADGRALPLADACVEAVLLDPPYTEQYAEDLYGVEYPRPAHLLREAARVVKPDGRIGFVHYLVPMPPPNTRLVKVLGLSMGLGFSMRAVTIYQRGQAELDL